MRRNWSAEKASSRRKLYATKSSERGRAAGTSEALEMVVRQMLSYALIILPKNKFATHLLRTEIKDRNSFAPLVHHGLQLRCMYLSIFVLYVSALQYLI